jgi:hypothetical protein
VIVVVFIAGVLTALASGIYRRSVVSAKASVDESSLRQIGQAREMYLADFDDSGGSAVDSLRRTGYVAPDLFASPLDPTVKGYGNDARVVFRDYLGLPWQLEPMDTKFSFLSFYESGHVYGDWPEPDSRRATGWLVALRHGKNVTRLEADQFYSDTFSRLTYDGAVVFRQFRWGWIDTGVSGMQWGIRISQLFEDLE